MKRVSLVCMACSVLVFGFRAEAGLEGGRAMDGKSETFRIGVMGGQIMSIDGTVRETKRAYTDIPGFDQDYGQYLEDYSLEELGFTDSYASFGLSMEKQWTYFSFLLDGSYVDMSADSVARRVYALGVEEVKYNGQEYEYMLIPEGTPIDGEIQGGIISARGLITPCHITSDTNQVVSFSPWLHLGIFSVFGRYEIDAGEPQGVTTYEYHDYEYVVGGKGSGWAGIVVPEYGVGGEVRLKLGKRNGGDMTLSLQGDYAMLDYTGSTEDIGISARHNKDLDLSYSTYELRAMMELPLSKETDLLLGVSYRHLEADATIEAKDRSSDEQEDLREKYDKQVDFSMDTFYAMIGWKW